jgi:integrase
LLATVQRDPRLHAFVLLCLGGGLRRGEVLGLNWGAVDLETGRLTVRARVSRVRKNLGGLIVRPGAKSEAGERVTYVAPFVLDALRRLRAAVRAARLAAGDDWQGEDDPASALAQVFVTSHGTIWSPEDANKTFKRACVRAGLGRTQSFHGLRHDFASLLARLGVPMRVAMDMLGHSHELLTIYYQHASDTDRREAADKVGAWLRDAAGGA